VLNLKNIASEKKWTVRSVFQETASGTVKQPSGKSSTNCLSMLKQITSS